MNNRFRDTPFEFAVRTKCDVTIPVGFRTSARRAFVYDYIDDAPPYAWVRCHGAGRYYVILGVQITKSADAAIWMVLHKDGKRIGEIVIDGWKWPDEGGPHW